MYLSWNLVTGNLNFLKIKFMHYKIRYYHSRSPGNLVASVTQSPKKIGQDQGVEPNLSKRVHVLHAGSTDQSLYSFF